MDSEDFKTFEAKYKDRIKKEFDNYKKNQSEPSTQSRQYQEFKRQWIPKKFSLYEKACEFSEKLFKVQPDKKEADILQESIDSCHLNVTPTGIKSFSFIGPIAFIVIVSFLSVILPVLMDPANAEITSGLFFVLFAVIVGLIMIYPLAKLPIFIANNWRMKASNQMVLSIFYIVTYMRHTSNFENAVDFAAEHLPPPLSLDLKKIIWNVETEKYSNIKESMDAYLEGWKKWNMEYVESMHLIESSLYESSDSRRLDSLDKALTLMLDETYENMLHYAHNLQSPLTMLNMLGIVLPILGLVILPLVVSFIPEVKWYHLFALYNIVLPVGVYYLGRVVLSTRPTGYGESDIAEDNPELKKYRNILFKFGNYEMKVHPIFAAVSIFLILFFIGIIPILIHFISPGYDYIMTIDGGFTPIDSYNASNAKFYFIGYKQDISTGGNAGKYIGPFGLGAAILSLAIPLSLGLSFGLYYKLRSKNVMKIRNESKKLEKEFAGALFQLGNRIGDGLPVEIAFSKVADVMAGTTSGRFFELVSINITKLGMNVEQAIFDKKQGALVYYPSNLIESSMKVLVESAKKGPLVASQALINVSEYIKQIHRVDERLKDLMADTISSMDSQISFLTPAIAGVVIGITSMITTILGTLSDTMRGLGSQVGSADTSTGNIGMGLPTNFFGLGIPTFYFQFIVGIYVVQIIYIMTIIVNGIKNGADPLSERHMLGQNLIRSTVLYVVIALLVMIVFNIVAGQVLSGLASVNTA